MVVWNGQPSNRRLAGKLLCCSGGPEWARAPKKPLWIVLAVILVKDIICIDSTLTTSVIHPLAVSIIATPVSGVVFARSPSGNHGTLCSLDAEALNALASS